MLIYPTAAEFSFGKYIWQLGRKQRTMADAFSAGFREFCGGVQHAVSGHRILLFFLNSRLICVSSAKVRCSL